jgi:hypothetical protein
MWVAWRLPVAAAPAVVLRIACPALGSAPVGDLRRHNGRCRWRRSLGTTECTSLSLAALVSDHAMHKAVGQTTSGWCLRFFVVLLPGRQRVA